jgi:hypothetical protein
MCAQTEISGRDETLAACLYSGAAQVTVPQVRVVDFEYTIRRPSLLAEVAVTYSPGLSRELSAEHRALLERGEEQSPEDLAVAERMIEIQRDALTR